MEEEKKLYYRLFIPLTVDQYNDVIQKWEKSIDEDIYIRKKLIYDYCDKSHCDFLSAICEINEVLYHTIIIQFIDEKCKYITKYFSTDSDLFGYLNSFLENRMEEFLNDGKPITDDQRITIDEMVEVIIEEKFNISSNTSKKLKSYLDSLYININNSMIKNEQDDIEEQIKILSFERQKKSEEYINDKLNNTVGKLEFEVKTRYLGHTEDMYFPVSKTKTRKNDIVEIKNIDKINYEEKMTELNPVIITAIKSKLSEKQANCLVEGLIILECIDKESKDDMLAFLGINKSKQTINSINWKKSKNLCAYFIDAFNTSILKNERVSWKPFEPLFSLNGLAGAKNDYNKTGKPPKFYKEITELFDKVIKM